MIGGRARARFASVESVSPGDLEISIEVLGGPASIGKILVAELPPFKDMPDGSMISIVYTEDLIRFYTVDENGVSGLRAAFIPDEVLWRRGRKEPFVEGFDNHLALATYDLLYVGIATGTDSYDRLIHKGHQARQQILSDEPQRYPGAKVSDEIYLMLFRAEPLIVKSWAPDDELDASEIELTYDNQSLVKDAEKAFISVLKPPYNKQLYKGYPSGSDGIYGRGYTGYTYSLSDGMVLRTAYGSMKGAREFNFTMSNDADFISVKGDEVTLHIAGVERQIRAWKHKDG